MIPLFPTFKKLEFSDKEDVERITHKMALYSDFDFASLWAWNVKEDMEVAELHGNIVIRFIDYLTGEPFYTFIGACMVNETIEELIALSEQKGFGPALHLVPHEAVEGLSSSAFEIEESRDHFDYILSLERYLTFSGTALKSRRNFLNRFKKEHPDYRTEVLDLTQEETKNMVTDLYKNWQEQKGFLSLSESFAYERFLASAHALDHVAIGLMVDGKLIAFHVSAMPPGTHANGLFEKGDTDYPGVYQALMHEVSKELMSRGKTHLNYEQDLGIESLRRSKMAFDPTDFHKKYRVRRKAP